MYLNTVFKYKVFKYCPSLILGRITNSNNTQHSLPVAFTNVTLTLPLKSLLAFNPLLPLVPHSKSLTNFHHCHLEGHKIPSTDQR